MVEEGSRSNSFVMLAFNTFYITLLHRQALPTLVFNYLELSQNILSIVWKRQLHNILYYFMSPV